MARSDALQRVLDCAFAAFDQFATDPRSRRSVARMFASLEVQGPERAGGGTRLPLCDAYLESALAIDVDLPTLTALRDGFRALEPRLDWRVRSADDGSASENFPTGHANTMIVGPGGLEQRDDLWFGATLMAPHAGGNLPGPVRGRVQAGRCRLVLAGPRRLLLQPARHPACDALGRQAFARLLDVVGRSITPLTMAEPGAARTPGRPAAAARMVHRAGGGDARRSSCRCSRPGARQSKGPVPPAPPPTGGHPRRR